MGSFYGSRDADNSCRIVISTEHYGKLSWLFTDLSIFETRTCRYLSLECRHSHIDRTIRELRFRIPKFTESFIAATVIAIELVTKRIS
jgi:hypothetical protein